MKVSRPQHLMYPVEKCGNPAESVEQRSFGLGGFIAGLNFGRSADSQRAVH